MDKKNYWTAFVVVTLAVTLPYLLAALLSGPEKVFTGFLLNPFDGASYLAKMRQGYEGGWQFTLPFTPEPGEGTYLFLFYLFLGKVALLTGLSLQWTFHLARLLGAWVLLAALALFFRAIYADRPIEEKRAFWLAVIGSGMGWMALPLGDPTIDFWVAEAFPFLSMLANPHFPLGFALLVTTFWLLLRGQMRGRFFVLAMLGLLISIVLPFALVVALIVAALWLLWEWWAARPVNFWRHWLPVIGIGILGGPVLLYQYWVAVAHPVLAGWNAQNLTPSPPLWDYLLSFSPPLVLSLVAIYFLRRRPLSAGLRLLIVWFAAGLLLTYLPVSLQRRFMLGWYIPAVGLAVYGIAAIQAVRPRLQKALPPLVFTLALPTNLLLLLIFTFGVLSRAPEYYLERAELDVFRWLRESAPPSAIVLASPELSRWVPGWTGQRVVYGHPFETVNAEQEETWVLAQYASPGPVNRSEFAARGIDYVIIGPRERELGSTSDFSALPLVYQSGLVEVRAVEAAP